MSNNILYIGLNGFAGSGKDTVAKMMKTILSNNWNSLEECKEYYKGRYTNPTISATLNVNDENLTMPVMCIAYADQLKEICANIFGLPIERFYMNKSTAWICINDKFQYTEIKPNEDQIITAEELYYGASNILNNKETKYWLSLRDILVYVGTYVLQENINKEIFVNIVRNKIKEISHKNENLKYVILTDNRFNHEIDFVRENNGIMVSITRSSVEQLNNVAEHELDDETDYDYIIENDEGYDELFEHVWDILHSDIEFRNTTIDLETRENINNYLRLIDEDDEYKYYRLCTPLKLQKVYHNFGELTMIDPVGGPTICIDQPIPGTGKFGIVPSKMDYNENKFIITVNKEYWDNVPTED